MDVHQLLDNIRADFFTEVCPFLKTTNVTNYESFRRVQNSIRLVKSVVDLSIIYNCGVMVGRNCIECAFINIAGGENVTYEERIYIRFTSSTTASMLGAIIFKQSKNPFEIFVIPIIDGVFQTLFLMCEYPNEASKLLDKRCPGLIVFLDDYCYLKEIKQLANDISDFIHKPRQRIRNNGWQ